MINCKKILFLFMLAVQSVFWVITVLLMIHIAISEPTYPRWDFRFDCFLLPVIAFFLGKNWFLALENKKPTQAQNPLYRDVNAFVVALPSTTLAGIMMTIVAYNNADLTELFLCLTGLWFPGLLFSVITAILALNQPSESSTKKVRVRKRK